MMTFDEYDKPSAAPADPQSAARLAISQDIAAYQRRAKVLVVGDDLMLSILRGDAAIDWAGMELPLDAKVVGVWYDPMVAGFAVRIQHPSFDEVPGHEHLPVVGPLKVRAKNAVPPLLFGMGGYPGFVAEVPSLEAGRMAEALAGILANAECFQETQTAMHPAHRELFGMIATAARTGLGMEPREQVEKEPTLLDVLRTMAERGHFGTEGFAVRPIDSRLPCSSVALVHETRAYPQPQAEGVVPPQTSGPSWRDRDSLL